MPPKRRAAATYYTRAPRVEDPDGGRMAVEHPDDAAERQAAANVARRARWARRARDARAKRLAEIPLVRKSPTDDASVAIRQVRQMKPRELRQLAGDLVDGKGFGESDDAKTIAANIKRILRSPSPGTNESRSGALKQLGFSPVFSAPRTPSRSQAERARTPAFARCLVPETPEEASNVATEDPATNASAVLIQKSWRGHAVRHRRHKRRAAAQLLAVFCALSPECPECSDSEQFDDTEPSAAVDDGDAEQLSPELSPEATRKIQMTRKFARLREGIEVEAILQADRQQDEKEDEMQDEEELDSDGKLETEDDEMEAAAKAEEAAVAAEERRWRQSTMLRLEEEEMACQARAEAAMTEAMLLEQDEARRRQESLRLGKERQHQRLIKRLQAEKVEAERLAAEAKRRKAEEEEERQQLEAEAARAKAEEEEAAEIRRAEAAAAAAKAKAAEEAAAAAAAEDAAPGMGLGPPPPLRHESDSSVSERLRLKLALEDTGPRKKPVAAHWSSVMSRFGGPKPPQQQAQQQGQRLREVVEEAGSPVYSVHT